MRSQITRSFARSWCNSTPPRDGGNGKLFTIRSALGLVGQPSGLPVRMPPASGTKREPGFQRMPSPAGPNLRYNAILLRRSVETFTDELCQFANPVGLGEEVSSSQRQSIPARHARTVAAGVNHLEAGRLTREAFCQVAAHDASRHDPVGQQQGNRTGWLFPHVERMAAGSSLQHGITLNLENLNHH